MKIQTHLLLLPLIAVFILAGCDEEASLTLPKQFIETSTHSNRIGYIARGISADKCVIALQERFNPKNGTLKFWAEVIRIELKSRGYVLTKTDPITSTQDTPGTILKFTHDEMCYWLAIFVDGNTVLIAEAGGLTKQFETHEAQFLEAFQSVKFPNTL